MELARCIACGTIHSPDEVSVSSCLLCRENKVHFICKNCNHVIHVTESIFVEKVLKSQRIKNEK